MGGLLILLLIVLIVSAAIILLDLAGIASYKALITNIKRKTADKLEKIHLEGLADVRDLSDLIRYIRDRLSDRTCCNYNNNHCTKPDLNVLNCRARLVNQQQEEEIIDIFSVEICGLIRTMDKSQNITAGISILDLTEGRSRAKAVHATVKQWQSTDSPEFCYNTELGRLPKQVTVLSDWTSIARLRVDQLLFAFKGKRKLQFNVKLFSGPTNTEIALAQCNFTLENLNFGYIDLQENTKRAKTLTVALAFAVSTVDGRLYDEQIELIKKWARDNIEPSEASDAGRGKLEKALNETVAFFRDGNQLNISDLCREIVEISPIARRYDILKLCLQVVKAKGFVTTEELCILQKLAELLEVDSESLRLMMDKIIPVSCRQVKDADVVLGITSNMSEEKAREYLNREYIKWNARVTNTNPEVQTQADQMLRLIAEARSRYVEKISSQSVENKR